MDGILRLEDLHPQGHQLTARFAIEGHRFQTSWWYDTVDLNSLENHFGQEPMQNLWFHIAAFEINKFCSLRPRAIDWGPWARFATQPFQDLWHTILHKVWAQWRFENDDPDYQGPDMKTTARTPPRLTRHRQQETPKVLAFFGGGKDSAVAAKLLEALNQPYDTLAYAHSLYGRMTPQHERIQRLRNHCKAAQAHRLWIHEDFMDSPVLELGPAREIRTLTAAETPASLFSTLPIALAHGITEFCLAHERSADQGQARWQKTGESINHQWGKSLEAEQLLDSYLKKHLLPDLRYYSLLKPIHDSLIFHRLRAYPEMLQDAHSCNIGKPWCKRCPKCLYVWIQYMAWLDPKNVDKIFQENLADAPENLPVFRALLGLTRHLPFECIGQAEETRLAFMLCIAKGQTGRALDVFQQETPPLDLEPMLQTHLRVHMAGTGIPDRLQNRLAETLQQTATSARSYLRETLGSTARGAGNGSGGTSGTPQSAGKPGRP